MENKTANFFSDYSKKFNAIYGTKNGIFQKAINRLFRKSMLIRFNQTLLICRPIEGKTVLDIGCGPGHYCIAFAQQGAKEVLGIDFAPAMIELAISQAKTAGVDNICKFKIMDFMDLDTDRKFDYVILTGFMDYIKDPNPILQKVRNLTADKAIFSFPASGGFLAWQRKIRYRNKCPLYLYSKPQLEALFAHIEGWNISIAKFSRDYIVVMEKIIKS